MTQATLIQMVYTATTWVIPLLLAVILHEMAHGVAALLLGDRTAKASGRLSLNPSNHIDPIGSVVVPVGLLLFQAPFLFGWAKPVPVDYRNLRQPKRDMGLVAAAGPAANVILAIVLILLARLFDAVLPNDAVIRIWIFENIRNGVLLSLALAAFNLLPILPLDGGRILASVLPNKWALMYMETERFGFVILLTLLFVLPMIGIDVIGLFLGKVYPVLAGVVQFFV